MGSVRTTRPRKVFIDSSVLIAAAISETGAARAVIIEGMRGTLELFLSSLVLEETERNLVRKAPAAVPAFRLFAETFPVGSMDPSRAQILQASRVVDPKDAPIVAAAVRVRAEYLATYDRRHLLAYKESIQARFDVMVSTPDEVLRALR